MLEEVVSVRSEACGINLVMMHEKFMSKRLAMVAQDVVNMVPTRLFAYKISIWSAHPMTLPKRIVVRQSSLLQAATMSVSEDPVNAVLL